MWIIDDGIFACLYNCFMTAHLKRSRLEACVKGKQAPSYIPKEAIFAKWNLVKFADISFLNAETALARLQAKNMLINYQVNAMGPILVSKVILHQ